MRKWLLAGVIWAFTASSAGAYYHYIHYTGRSAPYGPIPEKFDLNGLPAKTVTFFVSDTGPAAFNQTDSFPSVLSQIRQAAQAWNSVDSSDLRVAFGGLYTTGITQASPGGEVVFEDLAPGTLAYSAPVSWAGPPSGGNFVPIQRSVMHLARDLTRVPPQGPGPSYSDVYFLVTVHEMGHALGLQHTFTSSTMSTYPTRATSLSKPLDADDIAGISALYPAKSFGQFGSITGRITYTNGQGVHMASVVAIRSGAPAVSALTNPDGTFRIDGIAPGPYYVYAQALPPTADILSPRDPDGNPVAPTGAFDTTIYPGTRDFVQASTISVTAGGSADGVNFSVRPRASVPIYGVTLYSYTNQTYLKPALVSLAAGPATLAAVGPGILTPAGQAIPGSNAQVFGGSASVYGSTPFGGGFLALYLQFSLAATPGPQHLLFSQPDYLYVLPSGINLVQRPAPAVSSVTGNGDGTVTVSGTGFASDSQFYFDGLPAAIRSIDAGNGSAIVSPPSGASGQRATVTAFNNDGQNSLAFQASGTFTYDQSPPVSIGFTPSSLPAGSESLVDITGVNTRFAAGQTVVGFGTNDVFVRRILVLSPTHLMADVSIAPNAVQQSTEVSVVSGFQTVTMPGAFQIQAPVARAPQIVPVLVNAIAGQSGSYAGAVVSLFGVNLTSGNTPSLTIADRPVQILFSSPTQINFLIPAALPTGPAILKYSNGTDSSFPVAISIDPPPAAITGVQNGSNGPIDAAHPARAGDLVVVSLIGLADPGTAVSRDRVRVNAGGVDLASVDVSSSSVSGQVQVQFVLSPSVAAGSQPLIVYLDGRSSQQSSISVSKP